MEYKPIIDGLLQKMQEEKESAHEQTTKALNFEYFEGQLYMIYHP